MRRQQVNQNLERSNGQGIATNRVVGQSSNVLDKGKAVVVGRINMNESISVEMGNNGTTSNVNKIVSVLTSNPFSALDGNGDEVDEQIEDTYDVRWKLWKRRNEELKRFINMDNMPKK